MFWSTEKREKFEISITNISILSLKKKYIL